MKKNDSEAVNYNGPPDKLLIALGKILFINLQSLNFKQTTK